MFFFMQNNGFYARILILECKNVPIPEIIHNLIKINPEFGR